MRVGTESVDEPGNELTEVGDTSQVTPLGQPEATLKVTVSVKPFKAAKLNVNEAVLPAPTLCEVGDGVIVKSGPGGAVV
jgi:hypothetical protein